MKLLRGELQHNSLFDNGIVATIGNFDGVHLGHQQLISALKIKAQALGLPLVVILFEPQPKEYFQKEHAPSRLSTLREKLHRLTHCTVDYVYCIKFNKSVANTSAADFVSRYLNRLNVKYLLVGDDFKFGTNRAGDIDFLRTYYASKECEVHTFPELSIHNERVSSTKVRKALQLGDMDSATELLGRAYSICGRVIKGDGRGRQWGIPTANVGLHRVALPLNGVFVVEVLIQQQKVRGVANIGSRPTVDGTKNILEVHLFNFDQDIYGTLIQVFFLHKLRDEVKFTSIDALITQIHQDIAAATAYLDLTTAKV